MTRQASIAATLRRTWKYWCQCQQHKLQQEQQAIHFSTRQYLLHALTIWKKCSLLRYRATFVLTNQLRIQHHLCRSFRHWSDLLRWLERKKSMEKRLADCYQMVKKHYKVWRKRAYFDHWVNQHALYLRGYHVSKRQNTLRKRLHLQAWNYALTLGYREKQIMMSHRKFVCRGVLEQW